MIIHRIIPKKKWKTFKKVETKFIQGDCLDVLKPYENKFDLIVTSPPYVDARKNTYGGVKPDEYVDWFLPRSKEFLKVLKPDGTFILNIKEKVVKKERAIYVLELIIALRKQGWFWTEEFIWHKRTCFPGKWSNRFRDSWERCLQFNKSQKFNMYQDSVMVPVSEATKIRVKNMGKNDYVNLKSKTGSNFSAKRANWEGREKANPTNVLHFAAETNNKGHSAVFPEALPKWFIKLFSKPNDWVLDPFVGSGTTLKVAKRLNRNSIGIDQIKLKGF